MNRYLIGLDIGTSGAKCILTDEMGAVVASSTQEYPLYTPKPGWAEQNPEDWWNGIVHGLKAILSKAGVAGESIAGLSLSGQMHGLVALDRNREVLRPAILWCDQRTQKQCDELTARAGGVEGLLRYTNNRMLTGYTGGKILWMREEEPELYERMEIFCCPKDYIRYRLTGEIATDVSDASGTGFFDTKNRRFSDALIELAGLPRSIFPESLESTELAGTVTPKAAGETGLPVGLKVFAGGGDAVIQTTGAGLVKPGILGLVIGTAGNVAMGLRGYHDNPEGNLQMFCNNEPGLWHALGCTLTAGGAYRWYRDALCEADRIKAESAGRSVYDMMDEAAEKSSPGSGGVVFAPYLTGERCPYPDPNARGVFYGLSLGTTRGDITRAVMEGVTFSLCQVAELIKSFSAFDKVYTSGGGSASPLWRQIQADVFGVPVYTMSAASEGGAYGAVMVAGVGAGVYQNLNEAISVLKVETETLPIEENREKLLNSYELYKMLYPSLKNVYDRGGEFGY